jgi:phosphate transport system permease protein
MAQTQLKKGPERKPVFEASTSRRHGFDRVFTALVFAATVIGLVVLVVLLIDVAIEGVPLLSWQFLTGFPSTIFPETSGIYPALIGSLWLVGLTALISVPLGIGAAVHLEEYATDSWLNRIVEINISNLAGVPSIIYGLLALGIFVNLLRLGPSVIAGALALSLLILPVIIVATREALRAIPRDVREGGYALGATKWEVIWGHLLPMALPGALTGTILALSRAIGETAPLIVVGAVAFVNFTPQDPLDRYSAMPILIYGWVSEAEAEFKLLAAAGIIVLMVVLLLTNSVAIWLRNKYQRRA